LQELSLKPIIKKKRLKGVHTAAIYGKENLMYSIKSLPEAFNTWKDKEFY
jgi:hypothetical protein